MDRFGRHCENLVCKLFWSNVMIHKNTFHITVEECFMLDVILLCTTNIFIAKSISFKKPRPSLIESQFDQLKNNASSATNFLHAAGLHAR